MKVNLFASGLALLTAGAGLANAIALDINDPGMAQELLSIQYQPANGLEQRRSRPQRAKSPMG
jgi:hypothetical protein